MMDRFTLGLFIGLMLMLLFLYYDTMRAKMQHEREEMLKEDISELLKSDLHIQEQPPLGNPCRGVRYR